MWRELIVWPRSPTRPRRYGRSPRGGLVMKLQGGGRWSERRGVAAPMKGGRGRREDGWVGEGGAPELGGPSEVIGPDAIEDLCGGSDARRDGAVVEKARLVSGGRVVSRGTASLVGVFARLQPPLSTSLLPVQVHCSVLPGVDPAHCKNGEKCDDFRSYWEGRAHWGGKWAEITSQSTWRTSSAHLPCSQPRSSPNESVLAEGE